MTALPIAAADAVVHRLRTRAEDVPLARRLAAFGALMVFEFFYGWCWNTVDVLRPQFREALHISLTQAGSAYTMQGAGALVGAVVLGQLADRFGRRRMMFTLVIGYAVFAAAGAWVRSYPALLAQRACLGFFLGANYPVMLACYMSLFAPRWRGKLASLGNGVYNLAIVALGASLSLAWAKAEWRNVILAGAIPPLMLAPLLFVVPDDRKLAPWGTDPATLATVRKAPVLDLFGPGLARRTGLLFLVVGLNFFAYQAFAGWVTTYLKEVRGLAADTAGGLVAWQFTGATLGSFFWGWFSDIWGRRLSAVGFFGAGVVVALYLGVLREPEALRWAGFAWGFMISCSVAWGPWLAELYPPQLRSTAMSIFNWGRLISMTAPLITGAIADGVGLAAAMSLSGVGFVVAGLIWLTLPETLVRRGRAAPKPA